VGAAEISNPSSSAALLVLATALLYSGGDFVKARPLRHRSQPGRGAPCRLDPYRVGDNQICLLKPSGAVIMGSAGSLIAHYDRSSRSSSTSPYRTDRVQLKSRLQYAKLEEWELPISWVLRRALLRKNNKGEWTHEDEA